MSLLFNHAISSFSPSTSTLYQIGDDDLATTGQRVPVKPILDFAEEHNVPFPGDTSYTGVPLHKESTGELCEHHLGYSSNGLRGDIIIYKDESGERDSIGMEEFAATKLARRIRYWHSDYTPPEYPSSYNPPVDDKEPPTKTLNSEKFHQTLKNYVKDERRAKREVNKEQAKRKSPRQIFQEGGEAIPSVRYSGNRDNGISLKVNPEESNRDDWSYYIPNTYGIYQGNEILIHCDKSGFPVPATVTNIRGLNLRVKVHWSEIDQPKQVRHGLSNADQLGVSQLLNPVPTDRQLTAIKELQGTDFAKVLSGNQPLTFANGDGANAKQFDQDLNQEQEIAAEFGLLADNVFCIHGPPGTGKTRTLIEIVRRAVDINERVLVCADSNQAVNNITTGTSTPDDIDQASLHAYSQYGTDEFSLKRVNASRQPDELISQYGTVDGVPDVVASTNNAAATLSANFDLVIIDEATQATCASSCIPLSKADRAILAGDHKQLPPFSITDEVPDSELGMSLFEHLYASGGVYENAGVQLKTQYRMHRDIATFPNHCFYDKQLQNGQTIDPIASRDHPIEAFNIGGKVKTTGHSKSNKNEARLIAYLATDLINEISPESLGVITPYQAQVSSINDYLKANIDNWQNITVDTIDSFQGSEKEAILISLVRSNKNGDIGFLGRSKDGARRLNVAMTRAQRYCGIIGDFHTLRYAAENNDHAAIYDQLRTFLRDTGRYHNIDPDFLPI